MTAMQTMPTLQTPEGFLTECQRRGIKLTAQGGTIKASGKPPANPEKFAAFLKAKKPELLALLSPESLTSKISSEPLTPLNLAQTPPSHAPAIHSEIIARALALAQAGALPEGCGGELASPGRVSLTVLYWHDLWQRLLAQPWPDCQEAAKYRCADLLALCRVALDALDSSP